MTSASEKESKLVLRAGIVRLEEEQQGLPLFSSCLHSFVRDDVPGRAPTVRPSIPITRPSPAPPFDAVLPGPNIDRYALSFFLEHLLLIKLLCLFSCYT